MVTPVESHAPLVLGDDNDLSDPEPRLTNVAFSSSQPDDIISICTMDIVEEHRFQPSHSEVLAPPPAVRPRSPSVYSMFMTDHTQSVKPRRCRNPSVYSMPIVAASRTTQRDIDNMDDLGGGAIGGYGTDHSSDTSEELEDDYDSDVTLNDQVFMTKRSRGVGIEKLGRNTDVHSIGSRHIVHGLQPRCKNPSVYSMPIMGASEREVPTSREMRTLRVVPLVPLPFAVEEAPQTPLDDKSGHHYPWGEEVVCAVECRRDPNSMLLSNRTRPKRVVLHRVRPTASLRENVVSGFTSCRGRPGDDSLPPSYHVTVFIGIIGALFFLSGMTMTIIGFTSEHMTSSAKALQILGLMLLVIGFFMCLGCCAYLATVYLRFKRLSSYLKQRNNERQMRVTELAQNSTAVTTLNGSLNQQPAWAHQGQAARTEDINHMMRRLQSRIGITPDEPSISSCHYIEGDTPL